MATDYSEWNNRVNGALREAQKLFGGEAVIGCIPPFDEGRYYITDATGWVRTSGYLRGVGSSPEEALESAKKHYAEGTYAQVPLKDRP